MADKRAMFESKINEASKGPGFERVDHGPNFKPGWKASGNSGGGHTGTHAPPPSILPTTSSLALFSARRQVQEADEACGDQV
jgi:hypothetical protein